MTALHWLSTPRTDSHTLEVAGALLELGANIDAKTDGDLTTLFFALANKRKSLTYFLLRKGATVTPQIQALLGVAEARDWDFRND